MGKIVSIKDSKASYEIEEGEKTYYIRKDEQAQSATAEFASSYEVSIPKDTAVFNIHHDMNVIKEPVSASKALLVVGIILAALGFMFFIIGLSILIAEEVETMAVLMVMGFMMIGGGVALMIVYKAKSRTVSYRVVSKREETLIEILSANNKVFSLGFYDPSKTIYENMHKFIYAAPETAPKEEIKPLEPKADLMEEPLKEND